MVIGTRWTEFLVGDRLYLSDTDTPKESFGDNCRFFSTESELVYIPYCDDFGPLNLADVMQFCDIVTKLLQQHPNSKIILRVDKAPRKLTNAVFLMGSYMILALNQTTEDAWNVFETLSPSLEMYRDATFSPADFHLSLLDCWRGLSRAKALGWIEQLDMDEYIHYDNPLEGDLHSVVPGKLIAFRGPRSIPPPRLYADANGCRVFAPRFYADAFADMNVSTVIRLNEEEYDASEFEVQGIDCVDLEFEDCTNPPLHIIVEFLYRVDKAPGAVAVHCKAGLGRTGTLIGIYMMRSHGFTAREAIGWLRIVRPGSVIGGQQQFLCSLDPCAVATVEDRRPDGPVGDVAAGEPPERNRLSDASASSDETVVSRADNGWGSTNAPAASEAARVAAFAAAAAGSRSSGKDVLPAGGMSSVEAGDGDRQQQGGRGMTPQQQQAAQVAAAMMSPQRTALKVQQALSRPE